MTRQNRYWSRHLSQRSGTVGLVEGRAPGTPSLQYTPPSSQRRSRSTRVAMRDASVAWQPSRQDDISFETRLFVHVSEQTLLALCSAVLLMCKGDYQGRQDWSPYLAPYRVNPGLSCQLDAQRVIEQVHAAYTRLQPPQSKEKSLYSAEWMDATTVCVMACNEAVTCHSRRIVNIL